jgi:hypothetical protein
MSSTDAPRSLVFAGSNGSGKSSVTSAWQPVRPHINADDIKARRDSTDLEAAQEAERLRERCLSEHRSFSFETLLSTDRNLDLLARAKAAGYSIEGVFVLTADAELSVFRVRSRELSGGHGVPPEKSAAGTQSRLPISHGFSHCATFSESLTIPASQKRFTLRTPTEYRFAPIVIGQARRLKEWCKREILLFRPREIFMHNPSSVVSGVGVFDSRNKQSRDFRKPRV